MTPLGRGGEKMLIKFAFDLSRIWEHSVKKKSFGIVSAYKSELTEVENEERAELMKDYVRKLGYGYKEIYGVWKGGGGATTIEYPVFIPNLSRQDAISLGMDVYLPEEKRHPQEAVIVSDGLDILLIQVSNNTVVERWTQMEFGWREMWEELGGWSEYEGKEWRYSSVTWGMQEMPEATSWGSALLRGAYKSSKSTFEFDRTLVKKQFDEKED